MITGNFTLLDRPFADWFNANLKGKPNFPHAVNAGSFDNVMQRIEVIFGGPLNLYEFIAIFCNIYNETGGTFQSQYERGGMAYFFEIRDMGGWTKQSYNKAPNRLAGDQLKEMGFIVAHGHILDWNGERHLPGGFSEAVYNAAKRCDFYRFRGFGLNQITWRNAYEACLQPHLPKPMDEYTVEEFEVLVRGLDIACKAMNSYIRQAYMEDAMRDIHHGVFYTYGKKIGGGYYSSQVFVPRCTALVNVLSPYFLPNVTGMGKDRIIEIQKKIAASSPDAAGIIARANKKVTGGFDGIWGTGSKLAYLVAGL